MIDAEHVTSLEKAKNKISKSFEGKNTSSLLHLKPNQCNPFPLNKPYH